MLCHATRVSMMSRIAVGTDQYKKTCRTNNEPHQSPCDKVKSKPRERPNGGAGKAARKDSHIGGS